MPRMLAEREFKTPTPRFLLGACMTSSTPFFAVYSLCFNRVQPSDWYNCGFDARIGCGDFPAGGPEWTRTTDLTIISRVL